MVLDKKLFLFPAVLVILLMTVSCASKGGDTVNISNLGFSMDLPSGWKTDSQDPNSFYASKDRQNSYGDIAIIPSAGVNVMAFVDRQVESESNMRQLGDRLPGGGTGSAVELVSRIHRGVNGLNSVELIVRREGYHIIIVWIGKGQDIVRVTYYVPDDKFPGQKDSLSRAVKSIRFN